MARSTMYALALCMAACRASTHDFETKLEPKIVALLCDQDRPADQSPVYYRRCFEIDDATCAAVMQRTVHACADKLVRGTVDESNAGTIAERVGACAAGDYERELERRGKRIRSQACDLARSAYAEARAATNHSE